MEEEEEGGSTERIDAAEESELTPQLSLRYAPARLVCTYARQDFVLPDFK